MDLAFSFGFVRATCDPALSTVVDRQVEAAASDVPRRRLVRMEVVDMERYETRDVRGVTRHRNGCANRRSTCKYF